MIQPDANADSPNEVSAGKEALDEPLSSLPTDDVGELIERLGQMLDGVTELGDPVKGCLGFLLPATGPGSYQFIEETADQAASTLSRLRGERDEFRELVPTPLNTWGAKAYQIDYSRSGPGAVPRWCLGLNGVGHVPIAWFYRKADAERVIASEAARLKAEAERDELRARLAGGA